MNEIRDLIIGIDFGKDYSQICYYDRKGEEPCSVSMKVGARSLKHLPVFAGAESIKSTPLVLRQFILPGKKGDRW